MFVDFFIARLLCFLVLPLQHYYNAVVKGRTLVGAHAVVGYRTHRQHLCYVSYSQGHDGSLDNFGVSHDRVFCYLNGVWQTLIYMWYWHDDGWRFRYIKPIYAESID